ncbi:MULTISPECIES: Crp/Fnr family transcriptional regulator [Paraburkholderia]|uniref:Crp/Fnr family transcriptional regulator n=1 Tax=Paraburkholderia metrosideri TaxID=580937 RepID=A0ABW9E5D4_9BURK
MRDDGVQASGVAGLAPQGYNRAVANTLGTNWIDSLPAAAKHEVQAAMTRRQYRPGQTIYRAGESSTTIYQIVSGTVRFIEALDSGREALYGISGPGACFGMSPAVDGGPRIGTAVAAGPTALDCLSKADFDRLRDRHPAIDRALAVWAFQHLREMAYRGISHKERNLRRRFAHQLVFLLEYPGPLPDGRPRDTLEMTHDTLAAAVGATRQGISKILRDWSEAGIVRYHYGRFHVLDVERLRAIAQEEPD